MQKPSFGQRGISINGEPVGGPLSSPTRTGLSDRSGNFGAAQLAGIVFCAFLFLAWFEALLSGTSLITPINQTLLWGMRAFGLIAGFIVTLLFVVAMDGVSFWRRSLSVLVLPLIVAFGFGEIAYRISDWTEFGFSSQPFEPAQYPIDSIHWGRKGARDTVRIDPYDTGDDTSIPVNSAQYHELRDAGNYGCVTVMQRKSPSGAIEIQTNGEFMLNKPEELQVGPCGGSAPVKSSTSGSNPWSKD